VCFGFFVIAHPFVIPAKAGTQNRGEACQFMRAICATAKLASGGLRACRLDGRNWVPAFAGMTVNQGHEKQIKE
jgi:hypothetical protein